MTSDKPTLHDNVKLLEAILERVSSIDRNVDEILERLADQLNGEKYSWYDNHDGETNGYG